MASAFLFFNLFANSTFSMASGLLVVGFFVWVFRIGTGPWKLFLLSLPFAKIVYDCVQGVPSNSILLSGLDPFSLPPKHQLLQIGAGLGFWGPEFNLVFSVRDTGGREYAASIGDYLAIWLGRTFGAAAPCAILCVVLLVSGVLIAARVVSMIGFERRRRRDRLKAAGIEKRKTWGRIVDIYVSDSFFGTPFTGGLFRPYICVPRDALKKLDSLELEAVLAHELAHVRQADLAVTVVVRLLGDLFWFVPGYRWLSRKIDRVREIVADQWAVEAGAEPARLASALVKLKEIPDSLERPVLYSALVREKSLLRDRVDRLLGNAVEPGSRFGWNRAWFRAVLAVWICTAVMGATLGGNHRTLKLENPAWFDALMKDLGIEVFSGKQ